MRPAMKSGAPLVLAAVLMLASSQPSPAASPKPGPTQDKNGVIVAQGDQRIAAAVREARRTLPIFWSVLGRKDPANSRFNIKVGFPTDDGIGREVLWIAVDDFKNGEVFGRLASTPRGIAKLKEAMPIRIPAERVEDWTYTRGGKAYGHYTMRAMMGLASPEQRAEAAKILAPAPLEQGAR